MVLWNINPGSLLENRACDGIVSDPVLFFSNQRSNPDSWKSHVKLKKPCYCIILMLSAGNTLVTVLVGHGNNNEGSFVIGNRSEYRKPSWRSACRGISWHSGSWKSKHWTLLATAGPDQLAVFGCGV
jgi:hypothetical protein